MSYFVVLSVGFLSNIHSIKTQVKLVFLDLFNFLVYKGLYKDIHVI